MRRAFAALLVALGGFSLVGQALLFRRWLEALEGSELAIGSFFAAWLLWVGVGALVGRWAGRRLPASPRLLALFALAYLPAYALQGYATLEARDALGLAAWEIVPFDAVVRTAFLVNVPVSLVTGFLFTTACRVAGNARPKTGLPVARVWILECVGGFVGGVGVTLALAAGVEDPTVIAVASLLLAAATAWLAATSSPGRIAPALPSLTVTALLLVGLGAGWGSQVQEARDVARWTRLLPRSAWQGAFSTSQARYLHGRVDGELVLEAWGEVGETFPAAERGAEIAAIHLAEHPAARRIAVIGPGGLSPAARFAGVPGMERVVWLHPDPELPPSLLEVLPPELDRALDGVEMPRRDARVFLRDSPRAFDLVVLHLPDVTTLAVNRFATADFFRIARRALANDGVLSMRISGGENVLGRERAWLGASALRTLQSVFPVTAIKPGEETWLFGATTAGITSDADTLAARLRADPRLASPIPPEAVADAFPADRIRFQTGEYERITRDLGDAILLDTDREPRALLSYLALSMRRSGRSSAAADLLVLLRVAAWIVVMGLVLYGLLRIAWEAGRPMSGSLPPSGGAVDRPWSFDAFVLAFTAGLAGMALGVLLMNLHQARHGSLHLEVGLVSALFMLGLAVGGGLTAARLVRTRRRERRWLLPAAILAFALVAALVGLAGPDLPKAGHIALFLLAGAVSGSFFPVAAARMAGAGHAPGPAGSLLETADHVGGALGAAAAGLFLLPLVGTNVTLGILVLLLGVNLAPRLVPRRRRGHGVAVAGSEPALRAAGFVLLGLTAWILVGAALVDRAEASDHARRFEAKARELAGRSDLRREEHRLDDGATATFYAVPADDDLTASYVIDSSSLATDDQGYGGRLVLAIHMATDGTLLDYRVLDSRETPSYVAMVDEKRAELLARNLFDANAFAGVDAVTGATVTWDALIRVLEQSGRRFAREVLRLSDVPATSPGRSRTFDPEFLVLLFLTALALALRQRPRPWARRAYLLLVLLAAGYALNLQYSMVQVLAVLRLEVPTPGLTGAFFLVAGVPILVLLLGNVYCGYLCPYGAAQELLGALRRRSTFDRGTSAQASRWGRSVKYVLLAMMVALVTWTGRRDALEVDPLVTFFSRSPYAPAYVLGMAALLLSLPFGRFWCRNLCPAGAFLALLNRVQLLRRIVPPTRPGRCDLGVQHHWELDCICCDRCRLPEITPPARIDRHATS